MNFKVQLINLIWKCLNLIFLALVLFFILYFKIMLNVIIKVSLPSSMRCAWLHSILLICMSFAEIWGVAQYLLCRRDWWCKVRVAFSIELIICKTHSSRSWHILVVQVVISLIISRACYLLNLLKSFLQSFLSCFTWLIKCAYFSESQVLFLFCNWSVFLTLIF